MWQTEVALVETGRIKARVATLTPNGARTIAWANQARILQGRASLKGEVNMGHEPTYVGIDVAKRWVDVAVRPAGDTWQVAYGEAEIQELVAQLQTLQPSAVIVESTGGLEIPLAAALSAAAVPVAVVNPRQVRDFAKSTGQLAKTDRLDARILAHFGEAVRPTIRPLRDAETQALAAALVRRRAAAR